MNRVVMNMAEEISLKQNVEFFGCMSRNGIVESSDISIPILLRNCFTDSSSHC